MGATIITGQYFLDDTIVAEKRASRDTEMGHTITAVDMYAAFNAGQAERERRAATERAARAEADRLADERNAALLARCEAAGVARFVRYGGLPAGGRSYNGRDDYYEAGVSVYRAWRLRGEGIVLDLRGMDIVSSLCIVNGPKREYWATGRAVGTGADGEPLLADVTLRPIRAGIKVSYVY